MERVPEIVIAYEPIWAIGTGRSSNGTDANQVIGLIRRTIAGMFGTEVAAEVRIQYGGSVKPQNIKESWLRRDRQGIGRGAACRWTHSPLLFFTKFNRRAEDITIESALLLPNNS